MLTATTIDGIAKHFQGSYVLRQTNNIPGSTQSQRMWHIHSAKITPVN
ncbi:hypothetical protein WKK05_38570 (plasmid) [Nostoc sp. UHCC 0302]